MDMFIVIMDADGVAAIEQVKGRLRARFGRIHEYAGNSLLVATDEITGKVAEAAGIKGENQIEGATGVVIRIGGYAGFTDRSLWDWMSKVES